MMKAFITASLLGAVYSIASTPAAQWRRAGMIFLGEYGMLSHNTLGMTAAISCSFCFFFYLRQRKKKIGLLLLVAFELILIFLSGSRKAIFAVFLLSGGIYIFDVQKDNVKFLYRLMIAFIIILIGYVVLISNATLYRIAGRKLQTLVVNLFSDGGRADYSMVERAFYRRSAMSLFADHPVIGVGLNGFRSYMRQIGYSHVAYSHCNYTELLANYGIIGFALYYLPRILPLIWGAFSLRKLNRISTCLLLTGAVLFVLEYGFVSYYSTWAQAIWLIVITDLYSEMWRKKGKV